MFFEGWKFYEGWGCEAKQLDEEGSSRGLILSLLLEFIETETVLEHQNPADKLKELAGLIDDVFQLMPSGKHRVGRDLGCLESTALLQCRAAG